MTSQQKQVHISKIQNNVKKHFTKITKAIYAIHAIAKSVAEPGNSNLYKANSTPKACFFIRSTRTPKERLEPHESRERQSMVACNGKGIALCCIPCIAVFQPVTRYRQQAWKLQAVALINKIQGLSSMIYQFIGISRQHYDKTQAVQIRILAENETQARAFKAREYVLIPVGRLPDTAFNANTFNALEVANV